jgi:hypothetical protein
MNLQHGAPVTFKSLGKELHGSINGDEPNEDGLWRVAIPGYGGDFLVSEETLRGVEYAPDAAP